MIFSNRCQTNVLQYICIIVTSRDSSCVLFSWPETNNYVKWQCFDCAEIIYIKYMFLIMFSMLCSLSPLFLTLINYDILINIPITKMNNWIIDSTIFKHPFTCTIAGPTGSGKTVLLQKILSL